MQRHFFNLKNNFHLNSHSLRLLGILTLFTSFSIFSVSAADHGDGPNVNAEPSADISDYFIFPRNNGDMGKRVTMVLSINPKATSKTLFSDALNYRFRVRPIKAIQNEPFKAIVDNKEIRIDCRANGALEQHISCDLKQLNGETYQTIDQASVRVNEAGGGTNQDFRLWAGPAADQLFSDRARVRMPVWRDEGFDEGDWEDSGLNSQDGKNVLSIVIDLDLEKYFDLKPELWASVGETAMINTSGKKETLTQIDRMGRTETTVFIVRDDHIKNLWNKEDTFDFDSNNNLNSPHLKEYRAEIAKGLERLDRFELSLTGQNVIDWGVPHPWVDLIVDDFLIVSFKNNPDGTYGVKPSTEAINYFEIEKNKFQKNGKFSIGGRVINENIITRMLTFLINGLERPSPSRGVGVQHPARLASDGFPFVAPPFEAQ